MRARPVLVALLLLAALPQAAQEGDSSDPLNDLIEQERIRSIVETAYKSVGEARRQYTDDTAFVEAYTDLAIELGAADPQVVPLLANEAIQGNPTTFYLAVYGLALQATPEAVEAIRVAIERADEDDTGFGLTRKSQLIWALAVAGDPSSVVVVDEGRRLAGDQGMFRLTSTLEVAAMLTTPESIDILNEELSNPEVPAPEERQRTLYALRALQRIGHPSSLPALLRWAKSESPLARTEALQGLGFMKDEAATEVLIEALEDEHPSLPPLAARSLALQAPAARFDTLVEALDEAGDPRTRAALYEALARLNPQAALPILTAGAGAPNPEEGVAICRAAATMGADATDLLIQQVAGRNVQSAVCALKTLARIDSPRARRVVVHAIDSPSWPRALTASRVVGERLWTDAAATIRRRLTKRDFPKLARDGKDRRQGEWLVQQLTLLGDVAAIPVFEAALKTQSAPSLLRELEKGLKSLRAVKDAGDDLEKWEALATGDDADLRNVAYAYLGRGLHPDDDARILGLALNRVEATEGVSILRRLAGVDSDATRDLLERILTAPEYRRPELYAFRDMAAWAARRHGGDRMKAALRRCIELRDGRDVRVIVYYAHLAGAEAVPLIEGLLRTRLRYNAVFRGKEHDLLRKLIVALNDGRSLDDLDLPPNEIVFF